MTREENEANNPFNLSSQITILIAETERQWNGKLDRLTTGFDELDNITGGILPGELWVIAGRPSVGKTSFALSLADHISSHKKALWFYSSAHSEHELTARLHLVAKLEYKDLRNGAILDHQWPLLINQAARCSDLHIQFIFNNWISVPGLIASLETPDNQLISPNCIIIDKFPSLTMAAISEEGANNRINELARCVIELKGLAQRKGIPVIIVADLYKQAERRADQRPQLIDVSDHSGSLEASRVFRPLGLSVSLRQLG